MIKPGIYTADELSNRDYHRDREYVSSSGIKLVTKSLSHFYAQYMAKLKAPELPRAFAIGTAVHTKVLEPHLFDQEFAIAPEIDKRTKAGKEAHEQFALESQNKEILSATEFEIVNGMYQSIMRNPQARQIIDDAMTETSYLVKGDDINRKARTDAEKFDYILDLKTTKDLSRFKQSVIEYGYDVSAAWYMDTVQLAKNGEQARGFLLLAVEKSFPYAVAVYELSPETIAEGRRKAQEAIDNYRRAMDTNTWLEIQTI